MTAMSVRRRALSPLARREARFGLLFVAPWIVGFFAFTLDPDDRHVPVHVHQHQPRPGRTAPVRRPRQLRAGAPRPADLGVARRHPQVRAHRPAGRGHPAVPRRAAAQQPPSQGGGALPDPVLHAVRRAVRGRRPHLGVDAQPGQRLDRPVPPAHRHLGPAELAGGPRHHLPGPGDHRHLGHRRRDHRLPGRACVGSRPSCTTRRGSTAPERGRASAT